MRTRLITLLVVLGLLAVGTGGVIAASGGGTGGSNSAAVSQYHPKCKKGQHFDKKKNKCVPNKPPKCGKGRHFDKKKHKCVPNRPRRHRCGNVRSGRDVRAVNTGCREARNVVRADARGRRYHGYKCKPERPRAGARVTCRKGNRTVTYRARR